MTQTSISAAYNEFKSGKAEKNTKDLTFVLAEAKAINTLIKEVAEKNKNLNSSNLTQKRRDLFFDHFNSKNLNVANGEELSIREFMLYLRRTAEKEILGISPIYRLGEKLGAYTLSDEAFIPKGNYKESVSNKLADFIEY